MTTIKLIDEAIIEESRKVQLVNMLDAIIKHCRYIKANPPSKKVHDITVERFNYSTIYPINLMLKDGVIKFDTYLAIMFLIANPNQDYEIVLS